MQGSKRHWTGTLLGIALLLANAPATARPLDLNERRARPIRVAIEISPSHLPARLDHSYSERGPAWFEPGPGPGHVTVRITGADLEQMLRHSEPVPGSFSDYIWIFEAATGHVLSATVDGAFYKRVDFGLVKSRVQASISARMSTLRASGFMPPRWRMGNVLFEHCLAGQHGCSTVVPLPLDPATGYVNAVGKISVRALGGVRTETYSPLGEAVFTEMRAETAVSAR
ncbi:MAG: hypothetical protein ACQGVC_26150 [Myxococcota bacterium]